MSGTIGILAPGEMGAGIGGALARSGWRVLTLLDGRGAESRTRAAEAGMEDAGTLDALLEQSEIFLSIVPPAVAVETAELVAAGMRRGGARPVFVECNAIAPAKSAEIAALFAELGAEVVDGGIIGMPPPNGAPRVYVSGAGAGGLERLSCEGFKVISLGERFGDASAIKMTYAAMTKGMNALIAAALLTSERLDILQPLLSEMEASQPALFAKAKGVSRWPADSARWAPEMLEISRTFDEAGAPGAFHQGCFELLELLARSPYAQETRRTIDQSRSMEETIKTIAKLM